MKPLHSSSLRAFYKQHVKPKPGRTLIVGSQIYGKRGDRRSLYPDAVGVDMLDGQGVDRVLDLEEQLPDDLGTFAHVDCISVLEHSKRPWLLAANIERLLESGGTLYLQVPFVWRTHAYPNDYFRFTTEGVRALFPGIAWAALCFVNGAGNEVNRIEHSRLHYFPKTEVCGWGAKA